MIINGTKNVPGFFIYDENAQYQKNDFVVENGTIYVCDPEKNDDDISESSINDSSISISGEVPSKSKNFSPYLSNLMSNSIEEWTNFLESNGTTEDKYINLKSLSSILNMYQLGTQGKGIIGSSILYDKYSEETYTYVQGNSDENSSILGINKFQDYSNILGEIMTSDEVNNAVIRVSRDLPELANLGLNISDASILYKDSRNIDINSCILRQYSWIDENNRLNRVQEITDHLDGSIFYRAAVKLDDNDWSSPGNFITASMSDTAIKTRLNSILSIYQSKLKTLEELKNKLKKNFRFKTIGLNSSNSEVEISDKGAISINSYDWSVSQNTDFSSYNSLGYAKVRSLVTVDTSGYAKNAYLTNDPELQESIAHLGQGVEVRDLNRDNGKIIISFDLEFGNYSRDLRLLVLCGNREVEIKKSEVGNSKHISLVLDPEEVINSGYYREDNGFSLELYGYYEDQFGHWRDEPEDEMGVFPPSVEINVLNLDIFAITDVSINKSNFNTYIGIPKDNVTFVDDLIDELYMVTVIINGSDSDDIITSNSVTFDSSDIEAGNEAVRYRIDSSNILTVSRPTENSLRLIASGNNVIKSIYYQKYY